MNKIVTLDNIQYFYEKLQNEITINGSSSSGGSGAYVEVNHGTSDTTFTLTPNTFHVWDEVAALDLSFADETAGIANEFLFQFTSGATATTLTLPDSISWSEDITIESKKIYQISILKGLGTYLKFDKSISLITFTVSTFEFQAEDGMRWVDLLDTTFNRINSLGQCYFSSNINNNIEIMTDGGGKFLVQKDGINVKTTDIITPNYNYTYFIDMGEYQ